MHFISLLMLPGNENTEVLAVLGHLNVFCNGDQGLYLGP